MGEMVEGSRNRHLLRKSQVMFLFLSCHSPTTDNFTPKKRSFMAASCVPVRSWARNSLLAWA